MQGKTKLERQDALAGPTVASTPAPEAAADAAQPPWDPYQVWLTRVSQPRTATVASSGAAQSVRTVANVLTPVAAAKLARQG